MGGGVMLDPSSPTTYLVIAGCVGAVAALWLLVAVVRALGALRRRWEHQAREAAEQELSRAGSRALRWAAGLEGDKVEWAVDAVMVDAAQAIRTLSLSRSDVRRRLEARDHD